MLNWEKHQHHNGERTYDWFKISNTILDDVEIQSLTDLQFRTWVHLLALCARWRSRTIKVTLTSLKGDRNVRHSYIERALLRFEELQWVRIVSGTTRVPQNRTEENRREKKTTLDGNAEKQLTMPSAVVERVRFDFETLYKSYPRKEGKAVGLKKCKVEIKTPADFELLKKAIQSYLNFCTTNKTETRYIKHFSTFMTSWRDWLDEETGTAITQPDPGKEWLAKTLAKEKANGTLRLPNGNAKAHEAVRPGTLPARSVGLLLEQSKKHDNPLVATNGDDFDSE